MFKFLTEDKKTFINNYIRNKELVFNDIKKFIIYQNNINQNPFKYKLCVSNISN